MVHGEVFEGIGVVKRAWSFICLSASPYPASRRRNRPPCRFEALDMRYRGTRVARAMSLAPHDDEMTAAH